MKLDRNTNPTGRGKYALIRMRELREPSEQEANQGGDSIQVNLEAIDHGKKVPFFVIRYSDPFAEAALCAYAQAVREYAAKRHSESLITNDAKANAEAGEMWEWADEIEREVIIAERTTKKLPD